MNRWGANGNGAANGECGCCGGNGESFSSLRNRTVNASVGHPLGIVYPSSCLIIMVMMDNYYALGSPVPLCPPSWRWALSGQMASPTAIVTASCNIKNEMQSFSERGNVSHKKNKATQELQNRRINPESNCSRADLSFLHDAAFSESIQISVEASRVPDGNIQIWNISLKNMSDIGGGLFFKDVVVNGIMRYTYVFFFRGMGCRSLVRILWTRKKVEWKCFRHSLKYIPILKFCLCKDNKEH